MTNELGYGKWEDLKREVRRSPEFRFDWLFKSRTPIELGRRVDLLIRLPQKPLPQSPVPPHNKLFPRVVARKRKIELTHCLHSAPTATITGSSRMRPRSQLLEDPRSLQRRSALPAPRGRERTLSESQLLHVPPRVGMDLESAYMYRE